VIYLDNNATTRVAPEVVDAMTSCCLETWGNPHSPHAAGRAAHRVVEAARGRAAALVCASPADLIFTSCGTESNALVIHSLSGGERRKIVASELEHPSVLALLEELARRGAIELATIAATAAGTVDLADAERKIDAATALVAVMLAQNETGVVQPVREVAEIAHRHGALLLVDAVQAAGKIPIDVAELGADYLSLSGHKFHAPKGIGVLFARSGAPLSPLWRGGGQERGLRSGTEPVPLIAAVGCASALALEALRTASAVAALRDDFETSVRAAAPHSSVHGVASPRLPNTSSIGFPGWLADRLVAAFDEAGLAASAGAACHSGSVTASRVLRAMGVADEIALGTVRFSLSRETTRSEIDEAAAVVRSVIGSGAAAGR
jgi:cysteine desulfurase